MNLKLPLFCFLSVATLLSADEPAEMRAAAESRAQRELPALLPEPRSYEWQAVTPRWFKRPMLPAQPADLPPLARFASPDSGYVERMSPALEQLALGLSADPPQPEFPSLAAGPRVSGDALAAWEYLQIPPLSRSVDAPLTLTGDPATVATRPYTAPLVTTSRSSPAARNEIAVPDPFLAQREISLPVLPADRDPPAANFAIPERPVLPVLPPK